MSSTIVRCRDNIVHTLYNWSIIILVLSLFIYFVTHEESMPYLKTEWFQNYWTISFHISLIYITFIFIAQYVMKNYSAFDLKSSLAVWNLSLAVFSSYGAIRVLSEMIAIIGQKGWYSSYCDNSYYKTHKIHLWYFLFVISKVVELGDTVFIVLRKQRLQFIHWIHHIITLIYAFYISAYLPAIGRWMSAMNFLVHSIMYSYFALKVLSVKIPKIIPLLITSTQVLQMFVGLTVNSLAFYEKITTNKCSNESMTTLWGTLMYTFYVFLFLKLFRDLYLKPKFYNKKQE